MPSTSTFSVPEIHAFQFDSGSAGAISKSVNMFRGELNFLTQLFSFEGRNGINVQLSALYQSNISQNAAARNIDAPTGILGLGWQLPIDQIFVDNGGTASAVDNEYYLQSGGSPNRLYRISRKWKRGTLDPGFVGVLNDGKVTPALKEAFADQSLLLDATAVITVTVAGKSWNLTDAVNEVVYEICFLTGELTINDGGCAYELEQFQFWRIRYYAQFERWEITKNDGNTTVFGGGFDSHPDGNRSIGNSVQWGVKWGNWIGQSILTHDPADPSVRVQQQYPLFWNQSKTYSPWSDEVNFEYLSVEQKVGLDGLPYTKAAYLKKITDVFGRTAEFNYGEKEFDMSAAENAREYGDPNKKKPDNNPNAYQSRYETKYLQAITLCDKTGDELFTLNFKYQLKNFSKQYSSAPPTLYGDMMKRILVSFTKTFPSKESFPGVLMDYYSAADSNPGSISAITYPEGGKINYTYQQKQLPSCSRSLTIPSPISNAVPRTWFGLDYSVITWYDGQGQLHVTVYTWTGRWREWQIPDLIIPAFISLSDLNAVIERDFFVLYYHTSDHKSAAFWPFHKDNIIIGNWLAAEQGPFTTETGLVSICSGRQFFTVGDNVRNLLTRFTWNITEKKWMEDVPLAQLSLTGEFRYLITGLSNIFLALQYDVTSAPGNKKNVLTLQYLDELGIWQNGDELNLPELSVTGQRGDLDENFTWSASPGFFAATYLSSEQQSYIEYVVDVFSWGANQQLYQFNPVVRNSYRLPKSQPSGNISIAYKANISSSGMLSSGPNLLRFNGKEWLSNSNLAIELPVQDNNIFWFAPGTDLVIKSENSENLVITEMQVFDPDTNLGEWKENKIILYKNPPKENRHTHYFPTASQDFISSDNLLYGRGTSDDWKDAVTNALYQIKGNVNTTSVINEGPNFLAYLETDSATGLNSTKVLVLKNGFVQATEVIPENFFCMINPDGSYAPGVNGRIPAGSSSLLTYLPLNKPFDAASSLTLHRYLNDSVTMPLMSMPISHIRVFDGFQTIDYGYEFDIDSASIDTAGNVAKFYSSKSYTGESIAASPTGYIQNYFFNGLKLTDLPTALDGMQERTLGYDSLGTVIYENTSQWTVKTTIRQTGGDLADLPISGLYLQSAQITNMQDGLANVVRYKYDDASGQVVETLTSGYNGLGELENYAASQLYGYQQDVQFAFSNNLAALVQSEKTVSSVSTGSVPVTIQKHLATWKNFEQRSVRYLQIPAAGASYYLKSQKITPVVKSSLGQLSAEDLADDYFRIAEITGRTEHGLISEQKDPTGLIKSILYDSSEELSVAVFSNASLSAQEAFYYGFEDYENPQGWNLDLSVTPITSGNSCTGKRSLQINAGQKSSSFALAPGNQQRKYLFGFWAKTGSDFDNASSAGFSIDYSQDGIKLGTKNVLIMNTNCGWNYFSAVIDFSNLLAAADSHYNSVQQITASFTAFNDAKLDIFIDNVSFASYVGQFVANVYEHPFYNVTAEVGPYNQLKRTVYDPFNRVTATVSEHTEVLTTSMTYLSRSGSKGVFDPIKPNQLITCKPNGATYYGRFNNGGVEKNWTTGQTADWIAADGRFTYSGKNSGSLTLIYPQIIEDFYVYADFYQLGASLPDFGFTIGGILSVSYDSASQKWKFKNNASGEDLLSDTQVLSGACSLLLINTEAVIVFVVNGSVIFSNLPAKPVTGIFGITASGPVAFGNFLMGTSPDVESHFFDGSGRIIQTQTISGSGYIASAKLYDEAGREAIDTKSAFYKSDQNNSPLIYRPTLVTAFDWDSGIMQGDIAGSYPEDEGYPYSRKLYFSGPLDRVKETGAPGKEFAITDLKTTSPDLRKTIKYSYGVNQSGQFPEPLNLPDGQFYLAEVISQNGIVSKSISDVQGRHVAGGIQSATGKSDYLISSEFISYDAQGRVECRRLPNYYQPPAFSTNTDWEKRNTFNLLGQLVAAEAPDSGAMRAVYDIRGKMRFSQDAASLAAGCVQYAKYDEMSRILEQGTFPFTWDSAALQIFADSSPEWPSAAENTRWAQIMEYDGDGTDANLMGMLTRVKSADMNDRSNTAGSIEDYLYDFRNRLVSEIIQVPGYDSAGYQTSYGYNTQSDITRLVYPTGNALSYSYDALGRLSEIAGKDKVYVNYDYNADGSVNNEILNSGSPGEIKRQFAYNPVGWLTGIVDGVFDQSLEYTENGYNGSGYYDGKIAAQTVKISGIKPGTFLEEIGFKYQYDNYGQLTTAQCISGKKPLEAGGFGVTQPMLFDANGNILKYDEAGTLKNYVYRDKTDFVMNTNNSSSENYQEGAGGTVTAALSNSIKTVRYDLVSKLAAAIEMTDGSTLSFEYDKTNKRVLLKSSENSKLYIYGNGSRSLVEKTKQLNGTELTSEYFYGAKGLLGFNNTDGYHTVLTDHQGSVRVLLDTSGEITAAYHYQPYGELLLPVYGNNGQIDYLYAGYEWNEKTGLYLTGSRLYDPVLKRFYNVDPAGQYPSPYTYAGNNPLSFIDPSGEFSIEAFFAGLAFAIVGVASIIATAGADTPAVVAAGGMLGGTFIGTAVSAVSYSATAPSFNGKAFGTAIGIGAATGLLTSAAALGVASVTNTVIAQAMTRMGASFGENAARDIAVGAVRGVVVGSSSSTVGQAGANAIEGKSPGDNLGLSALLGAATGGVFDAAASASASYSLRSPLRFYKDWKDTLDTYNGGANQPPRAYRMTEARGRNYAVIRYRTGGTWFRSSVYKSFSGAGTGPFGDTVGTPALPRAFITQNVAPPAPPGAAAFSRALDSEAKLFEQVQRDIGAGVVPAGGHLTIVSKWDYCASCRNVTTQFAAVNPGIRMSTNFMRPY